MSFSPVAPPQAVKLVQQVQARASEASHPTVSHQHVASRSVLRRFTLPVGNNAQCLLRLDLRRDKVSSRRSAPKAVGAVEDFVPFGSLSMEEYWGRMESNFSDAFTAIEDGSLFTRPDLLSVVRDLVAIHHVRSELVKQQHFTSFDRALASMKNWWSQPAPRNLLIRKYRESTGDTGPDEQAWESAINLMVKDNVDLVASGQVLRQRMEDLFTLARTTLDNFNIEIWSPKAGAGEFLIGDAPAATVDYRTGNGLAAGAGLLRLGISVYMPLGPGHMAWVHRGPGDGFHQVGKDTADKANAVQVLAAKEHVFARPGTSFETFAQQLRQA